MLLLVVLVVWAVPRWLPRGGLVIRIGPAAPSPAAPAVQPARQSIPDSASQPAAQAPAPAAPGPAAEPADAADPQSPDSAVAPMSAAAGLLLVPVQGVRPSQLTDTYTQARGQGRVHDAIDIPAARGTPVLATAEGTVLKLFQSARGGTTLYELARDGRTIYYYAHLDRYAAGMAEGKALRQGEVIGSVGNTGNAGPGNYHLHFEVTTTADPKRYWAGTPQNPYPLLRHGISR
ncbi:M23 family metallopeptidase [Longimicrobium sp.]|uniref:M23 family metallopeptidase n=1 Tax=Longimicrobium sp. TaxID=2029185 RepID=UPI0039C9EAC0